MERDYTHYNKQREYAFWAISELIADLNNAHNLDVTYSKTEDGRELEIRCEDTFFPTHIINAIKATEGGFIVRIYYDTL